MSNRTNSHRPKPEEDAVAALRTLQQTLRNPLRGLELFVHDGLGTAAMQPVVWKALSGIEKLRLRKHYTRLPWGRASGDITPAQPDALVPQIADYCWRSFDGIWRGDHGYSADSINRCVALLEASEHLRHKLECSFRAGGIFAATPEGLASAVLVVPRVDDFPNARDDWRASNDTIRRWENRQLAGALAESLTRREARGRELMKDVRALEKQLWQMEELGQKALGQMLMEYDGREPFNAHTRQYLARSMPAAWAHIQQQFHHIHLTHNEQKHDEWWAQWRAAYDAYLKTCGPNMQELRIPRIAAIDRKQMLAYADLAQAQFHYVVYGAIRNMSSAKQVYLEIGEVHRHYIGPASVEETHYRYHNLCALQQAAIEKIISAQKRLHMPTAKHVEKAMAEDLDKQAAGLVQHLALGADKDFFAGHGLHPDHASRLRR